MSHTRREFLAGLLGGVALTGCASTRRFFGVPEKTVATDDNITLYPFRRQDIEALQVPCLGVALGNSTPGIMFLTRYEVDHGLHWESTNRYGLVTRAGRIVATQGLRRDLASTRFVSPDPLAEFAPALTPALSQREREMDGGLSQRERGEDGGLSQRERDGGLSQREREIDGGLSQREKGEDGGLSQRERAKTKSPLPLGEAARSAGEGGLSQRERDMDGGLSLPETGAAGLLVRRFDLVPGDHQDVSCISRLEPRGEEFLTILERTYRALRVTERLEVGRWQWKAENTYWIEVNSGSVIRSIQHVSPDSPRIIIDLFKAPA